MKKEDVFKLLTELMIAHFNLENNLAATEFIQACFNTIYAQSKIDAFTITSNEARDLHDKIKNI